ncbi:LexA family protein [Dongia sp.]|uniref:LexA family protein n=1 Tax=Dongia sp. TaxID=1977262 RepID=UPI0037539172
MMDLRETADAFQPQEAAPAARATPARAGMTPQQHRLLQFLYEREAQDLPAPSLQEMAAALGLKSKSGVHRLLAGLEERGHVRRTPLRRRSVQVVYWKQGAAPAPGDQLLGDALTDVLAMLPEHCRLTPSEIQYLIRETSRVLERAVHQSCGA